MRAPRWVLGTTLVLGLAGVGLAGTPPGSATPPTPPATVAGADKAGPGPEWAQRVAEMKDILDIRPPVLVGWDPRWRWVIAGVVAALGVGVGFWWWRRRPARLEPAAERTVRPAHEAALEALSALEDHLTGETKRFYFGLTAVVRAYLDDRFGVDTREKTTEEVLPVVRGLPVDATCRQQLVDLFRFADPVKYADSPAEPSVRGAHLAAARSLVEATRPRPETSGA